MSVATLAGVPPAPSRPWQALQGGGRSSVLTTSCLGRAGAVGAVALRRSGWASGTALGAGNLGAGGRGRGRARHARWDGASVVRASMAVEGATAEATVLATAVSYLVAGGAAFLYTPQISRLIRAPETSEGVSVGTFALKLAGYTLSTVYGIKKGLPFAVYCPEVLLVGQSAAVLGLVAKGRGWADDPRTPAAVAAFVASVAVLLAVDLDEAGVTALQLGNIVVFSSSLVPQLVLNYENKTQGDYSPLTAFAAAMGCAVRLVSASQLTSDGPLLATLGVGVGLNTGLLGQIVYYGTAEGKSIWEVMTSDLGGKPEEAEEEVNEGKVIERV